MNLKSPRTWSLQRFAIAVIVFLGIQLFTALLSTYKIAGRTVSEPRNPFTSLCAQPRIVPRGYELLLDLCYELRRLMPNHVIGNSEDSEVSELGR